MAPILQNFSDLWQRTNLVQRVLLVAILLACAEPFYLRRVPLVRHDSLSAGDVRGGIGLQQNGAGTKDNMRGHDMKPPVFIRNAALRLKCYSQAVFEIYVETVDEYPRGASAVHFIAGLWVMWLFFAGVTWWQS